MFDPNPELDQLLRKLLHPKLKAIDPSLDRIVKLLHVLDDPQDKLPPVIHIAGTNGKGSTLAFAQSILNAGGYRVHCYTSPHLVHFNERIKLNGEEIATETLFPILEKILSMQEQYPTTFFEATTIAAMLAFSEVGADFVLLETGMGGRLDATNVINKPAATIITPIGIDHAQFLGETLKEIAYEKAGILKAGVPAIIAPQPEDALAAIKAQGNKVGADMHVYGESWNYNFEKEAEWSFNGTECLTQLPRPALCGEHQYMNAATAIAALQLLKGPKLEREHIAHGIQSAKWPARLQPLEKGYWRSLLPDGFRLYLDGGHNEMAASEQAKWLKSIAGDVPIYLVFGMLSDKDAYAFLAHFKSLQPELYAVNIETESPSYSADDLVEIAKSHAVCAMKASTVEKAFEAIANRPKGIVLIAGSLYLAASILGKN